MKKVLRRIVGVLPRSVQRRIGDRYWQIKSRFLYQFLYNALGLEHKLQSGLIVKVASKGEWWVYNDIFVDGEYDLPICAALKESSPVQPFVVLDLGANVGYFAFRVMDLINQQGRNASDLDITMVEGSPKTFLELEKRIRSHKLPTEGVRIVHGLVGQTRGSGVIQESAIHVKSTTICVPAGHGTSVDFVDLDLLLADKSKIDLLKCDIEGAELSFIQNYSGLLHKVKHASFELHHDQCDTKLCVKTLEDMGFRTKILRSNDSFSVCLFSRS
jgi:FkbM family methyltransferase